MRKITKKRENVILTEGLVLQEKRNREQLIESHIEIGNPSMQILVDADACPVVGIVEKIASEYKIPVVQIGRAHV